MLYGDVLCYVVLCGVMWRYVVLCSVMWRYVVLCKKGYGAQQRALFRATRGAISGMLCGLM
jgi:hypothetical protein